MSEESGAQGGSVVQDWLSVLPWKQQSILFSGLRGPDAPNIPNIKIVNRWLRTVSQFNADPSKDYMKQSALPEPLDVCSELEFLPCHYVHHFADALAVVAYGHPEQEVAEYAASLHYRIAEEVFHFLPESREIFNLRHRDKPSGIDTQKERWNERVSKVEQEYLDGVLSRFKGE